MDNTKEIIVFSTSFYNVLKNLKSFIKNYFLENHKTIKLEIVSSTQIKCSVNMGRYVIHFLEHPEKCTLATGTVLNLPIELLKNYTENSENKQLKLVIEGRDVLVYSSGFTFPIKQTEAPEEVELPFVENQSPSAETKQTFKTLLDKCYQKENLISIQNNFLCEKLSSNLFHIEPFEFSDISFSFEDIKMINLLSEDEDNTLSFTVAPRYHVFTTPTKTFYIMKYKPELLEKEVFNRRIRLTKDKIINAVSIAYEDIKNVYNALNIAGGKEYGLTVGETCYLSSAEMGGYKLNTEKKIFQVVQRFILNKKEISTILKIFAKEEKIVIVTSKDFAIIGNKLLLMMRSIYNES